MTMGVKARFRGRYQEVQSFVRFCVVGAVGFLTDSGVLLGALVLGWGPFLGRVASFSAAVLVTWQLSRAWVFRTDRPASIQELFRYLCVQGVGLSINLLIYITVILLSATPEQAAFPALTLAASAAIIINYGGSRLLVFQKRG